VKMAAGTVLYICKKNIVRSQAGAGFAMFGENKFGYLEAISAGTDVSPEGVQLGRYYSNGARNAFICMKERGINLSNEKTKQLTREMVDRAKHIVVMVEPRDWPDYLRNAWINSKNARDGRVEFWDIPDPNGFSLNGYRRVIKEIKRRDKELVSRLEKPLEY